MFFPRVQIIHQMHVVASVQIRGVFRTQSELDISNQSCTFPVKIYCSQTHFTNTIFSTFISSYIFFTFIHTTPLPSKPPLIPPPHLPSHSYLTEYHSSSPKPMNYHHYHHLDRHVNFAKKRCC